MVNNNKMPPASSQAFKLTLGPFKLYELTLGPIY